MAIRIDRPNLQDTEQLLVQILPHVVQSDSRVAFLCPAGDAKNMLARIRVMLSRKRKKLNARGRRAKIFTLRSTIHPETHQGIRYDCIVVWRQDSLFNSLSQDLEDLLQHG